MTRLNTAVRLLALALVVGLAHADCQVQLDQLWSNYTNPAYTFTSCDANCLADCKETLEEAMYETQIEHCPPQSSITSCLQVYASQWNEYASQCAMFYVSNSSSSSGEGVAAAPAASTGEGASPAAPPGEGSSSGSVCFPTFSSMDEVTSYINGEYFTEYYQTPSNTAGIILSVFFWTGLAGMGFFLRK